MKIGDTIQFTDKTGEVLKGKITEMGFDGDPEIITALCYKPSWGQKVSCLLIKSAARVIGSAEDPDEILADFERRQKIADAATQSLEVAIELKDAGLVLKAYELTEVDSFPWDGLDLEFKNWDRLVTKGNDICYDRA